MDQKEFELMYAEAFLEWINKIYDYDYRAKLPRISENSNMPDIDVEGISAKGLDKLYLQFSQDRRPKNGKAYDGSFNPNQIGKVIEDKTFKYKEKDISKIILIIQGSATEDIAERIIKSQSLSLKYQTSEFRGIYYLSPPKSVMIGGVYYNEDWFVIPVKVVGPVLSVFSS
ncbi:MAG: hypothetical protein AAB516_02350 [Patescibacteria group bacterium]